MKQKRLSKYFSCLLYGAAALVLLIFLGKNTAAHEAHLIDIRNSAAPPPAVGAPAPEFSVETDGKIIKSTELPEKYALVLATVSCPYVQALLTDINADGGYRDITEIYAVYIGVNNKADAEELKKLAEKFDKLHICLDLENSVKWGFRCSGYPTTLVIENGKIIAQDAGYHGNYESAGDME